MVQWSPLSHSHCNLDCAIHMRTESGFNLDSILIESGLSDPTSKLDFDQDPAARLCNIVVYSTKMCEKDGGKGGEGTRLGLCRNEVASRYLDPGAHSEATSR